MPPDGLFSFRCKIVSAAAIQPPVAFGTCGFERAAIHRFHTEMSVGIEPNSQTPKIRLAQRRQMARIETTSINSLLRATMAGYFSTFQGWTFRQIVVCARRVL